MDGTGRLADAIDCVLAGAFKALYVRPHAERLARASEDDCPNAGILVALI